MGGSCISTSAAATTSCTSTDANATAAARMINDDSPRRRTAMARPSRWKKSRNATMRCVSWMCCVESGMSEPRHRDREVRDDDELVAQFQLHRRGAEQRGGDHENGRGDGSAKHPPWSAHTRCLSPDERD